MQAGLIGNFVEVQNVHIGQSVERNFVIYVVHQTCIGCKGLGKPSTRCKSDKDSNLLRLSSFFILKLVNRKLRIIYTQYAPLPPDPALKSFGRLPNWNPRG